MTKDEALKLALEVLENTASRRAVEQYVIEQHAIAFIKQVLTQPEQAEPVTVLPDGSAFAMMSWPLPKDHWLYAEREYSDGEYEPVELGKPILTHELREAVVSAVRYAIRGATNCGKEVDFDPDALVQNAVYALCGPYTSPVATNDTSQERVDEAVKQRHEQEPEKEVTITCSCGDKFYIPLDKLINQLQEDKSQYFPKRFDTHPTPPPVAEPHKRLPLTDERIAKEVEAELTHYWNGEYIDTTGAREQLTAFARAIEAAHGIKGEA